jgi:hypothetical protein
VWTSRIEVGLEPILQACDAASDRCPSVGDRLRSPVANDRLRRMIRSTLVVVLALLALGLVPTAASATACNPVKNPYPGTRYDGIDLSHIRAKGVACGKGRRVAEKAHRKGLGLVPSPDGYLNFGWNGWQVRGNLRPDSDRYRATRHGKRVRWRF